MSNLFKYKWEMSKDYPKEKNGKTVFSCFSCGGGSTMGYKLAGFDVLGCNEIDPKMMEAYRKNHNPKYSYLEPIQDFKNRNDLPDELYNLDILDGSPPCSSFSMAGNREKDWGKEKKFREGQSLQVLDTLFFDFIDLAEKLKPKIVIAENVKGLLLGEAKSYVYKILESFDKAGYYVDYKLLNAAKMGVPQRRERVFFYAIRKDLYKGEFVDLFCRQPYLDLGFNEKEIIFKEIKSTDNDRKIPSLSVKRLWENRIDKDIDMSSTSARIDNKPNKWFNWNYIKNNNIVNTIKGDDTNILYDEFRYLSNIELKLIGSYPIDYDFCNNKVDYLVGMSVPPVMTANIAKRIYEQWLNGMEAV